MAGDTGEFPDIRQYVKGGCQVCALPPDVVEYMYDHKDITSWSAWSKWLADLGHEVVGDRIRHHFAKHHEPA